MTEISTRQFIIIAIVLLLASKLDTMLAVVYSVASTDAIISIILNFVLELLLIFAITVVIKRNPDTNLFELLKKKFTVVGAYIIILLLGLYLLARLVYCYQELYSFFLEFLYDDFSPYIFALPTFFVTGYLAFKGARSLGRTLEIVIWFILIGLAISVVCNVEYMSFVSNMPYFENGASPMLDGTWRSTFFFGNSLCLLFFVGKVKFSDHFIGKTVGICAITSLITVAICFIIYDVFGYAMQYVIFALSEYAQYDPFILELQRLTWLTAIVDIAKLFCATSVFVYGLGQIGKSVMKTRSTLIPIIINFLLVFSIATIINYDLYTLMDLVTSVFSFATLGLIALTIIICIILMIKRRQNEQKFIQ